MTSQGTAPRVTVVIPTCNRAAFLPSAVGSALRQTVTDLEVVVVDDGSTDSTPALCNRLAAAHRQVRVMRQENRGPAAARNAGLAAGLGEWVAFLDDDDLWVPHALATLMQAASADTPVVACLAWRFFSDVPVTDTAAILRDPARFHLEPWPPASLPQAAHLRDLLLRPLFPIHAALFRTATVRALGGFDERGEVEDYDLWLRLAVRHPIPIVHERLALYRWHPQQRSAALRRQAGETRRVLERFLAAHPAGWAEAGRARMRRRLAFLHREESYAALLAGDAVTARQAALASVCLWPFGWKSWMYLAFAPWPRLYRTLRQAVARHR